MNIKITIGNHVVKAHLYQNSAAKAFAKKLPLTLPMMNLYDCEMCYRMGAESLPTDNLSKSGYQIGDMLYWPPAGSLIIPYKQTGDKLTLQLLGHIDDDVSFLTNMIDTDMTFEKNQ